MSANAPGSPAAAAERSSRRRRTWRERLRLPPRHRLPPLFFDRAYTFALPASPLDPLRGEKVVTALGLMGLLRPGEVIAPAPASLRDLLRVHDRDYLEALGDNAAAERAFGFAMNDVQRERALSVQRAMTGGTIAAARRALADRTVAVNVGGGFHHARRDRGQGFCLFNDIAVAIAALRRGGFTGRVLVVDLDLHDGDGTRSLFAADPSVYTYSLHNRHWDEPAAVGNTAIELGSGVDDATLLAKLRETLPSVLAAHQPELVFYLAGCDPAADDALGDWKLSASGMLARDRFVIELVGGRDTASAGGGAGGSSRRDTPPIVVTLAGGYGDRAWRYTARFLAWFAGRDENDVEPPPEDEVLIARYRSIARLLSPAELSGEAPGEPGDGGDDWGLTQDDLLGSLAESPADARLLGYYTPHGVELVMESSGIFDRLRDLGYEQPALEFDLSSGGGHMVRIWGGRDRRDLLAEIRMRRDRQAFPGFELLAIEWLLLQNPRAAFTAERPPLPGQRHPGLGMLRDVIALLVQVCHRLHLDGITYTPSHFHLASQSTKYLRFRDPRHAALFDELKTAVAGLPLAEQARRIDAGEVVDSRTGLPLRWRPMPMVLVVSDRLAQSLAGTAL
ncbi:MAG TPA: histone deacetylase [Thermoanaerobaculia bacterium]|jgi:acetoin utilization deacetylase AcuC-like enzyme|nr:histone deacetylase [Thermoanaerobaculia bacterium]